MEEAATYFQTRLMTPSKVPITSLKTRSNLQNPQLGQLVNMLKPSLQYSLLATKQNLKKQSKWTTSPVSNKGQRHIFHMTPNQEHYHPQ